MDYYEIGQRIRKFRKARSISQEDLAEQVGISTTHMSHIETGNTKLSLPVLVQLAEALNVGTDDLLFEKTDVGCNAIINEIVSILKHCTAQQLRFIKELLQSVEIAMGKYFSMDFDMHDRPYL